MKSKSTPQQSIFVWDYVDSFGDVSFDQEGFEKALLKREQAVRTDERQKVLAQLAVEVMKIEIGFKKTYIVDEFERGHLHGIKRSIYLISHLTQPEKEGK